MDLLINNNYFILFSLLLLSCSGEHTQNHLESHEKITTKLEIQLMKTRLANPDYPMGISAKFKITNYSGSKIYLRNFLMRSVSVEKIGISGSKPYSSLQALKPPFEIEDTIFERNQDIFTKKLKDSLLQVERKKATSKQRYSLDIEVQDAVESILYLDPGKSYETSTGLVWLLNGSGQYRIFFHYDPNSKYGVNSWFIPLPEQLNGYQRLTKVITSDTLYLNIK